jgi:hypothetical protein
MLEKANYRDPQLRPLDDEKPGDLIHLVETLVNQGIVKPQDVNMILARAHETRNTALATIDDDEFNNLEALKKDPIRYKKAFLSDITDTLAPRFKENMQRHRGVKWDDIYKRLKGADMRDLVALGHMEGTLGEPDVHAMYRDGEVMFYDFSKVSPIHRRGLTYPQAINKAKRMGVCMLDEEIYSSLDEIDEHSQSWIWSPCWYTIFGKAKVGTGNGWRIETISKWDYDSGRGFRSCLFI